MWRSRPDSVLRPENPTGERGYVPPVKLNDADPRRGGSVPELAEPVAAEVDCVLGPVGLAAGENRRLAPSRGTRGEVTGPRQLHRERVARPTANWVQWSAVCHRSTCGHTVTPLCLRSSGRSTSARVAPCAKSSSCGSE